ncbi:MAG: DUF4476 domain-containing protein [Bacteroidia bacterium]|nr:DUF4476 domain-containing protein [Bacteroidia bacterium]
MKTLSCALLAAASAIAVQIHAQPNTGTAMRPQTPISAGAQGCYREERVWVEGRWETGPGGRKTWREGGWAVRQIPIPCPPPPPVVPPPVVPPSFCPAPTLSPTAFEGFLNVLRGIRFDSDRLAAAKEMTEPNCLSAAQVAAVVNEFGFESHRLDFAKFAYTRTHDPQNYFLVFNALRFSSGVRELQRYINGLI